MPQEAGVPLGPGPPGQRGGDAADGLRHSWVGCRLQLPCGHTLPRALPWAGSSAAGRGEARQFQGTGPGAGLRERVLRQGAGRLTPQDHRGGLSGRGPARAGGPGGILRTLASSALPLGATVATLALALPPTLSRWNHRLGLPHREQSRLPGLGSLCAVHPTTGLSWCPAGGRCCHLPGRCLHLPTFPTPASGQGEQCTRRER